VHLVALTLEPPGPKGGAPATQGVPSTPAGGAAPPPPGGGIMMFLPFLILIPFFFLMSRRNKKESEARQKLKKGDRVASTAGLVGELIEMDEKLAKVKIAPGVTVQMLSSSISPLETAPASADAPKDAKPATDKK
jgi:preprotein translocase subunit YajC